MLVEVAYGLLWLVVVIQALLICYLVREVSELRKNAANGMHAATGGLPIGSESPAFSAVNLRTGEAVHSSTLIGRAMALLLLTPECADCRRLASQLSSLPLPSAMSIVVLCNGEGRRCSYATSKVPELISTLVTEQLDLASAFQVRSLPALVLLDEVGKISGYRYPYEAADLLDLVEQHSQPPEQPLPADLVAFLETRASQAPEARS